MPRPPAFDPPSMRDFQHPWGWTSAAPILCAVHCAATPVVAFAAPVVLTRGTAVEWGLLAATAVLATAALFSGVRAHGDVRPLYTVLLGLGVWVASLLHLLLPVPEDATITAAALTTATGLLWNSRLHCGLSSSCSACEEGTADEPVQGNVPAGVEEPASG